MKKIQKYTARPCANDKQAFTLVELLVTIAIIALLAAILLPALRAAFLKAERNTAANEVSSLKAAVQAFLNDYGKLPVPATHQGQGDKKYTGSGADDSKVIIKALIGNDSTINPRSIAYLESKGSLIDGTFLDPWDSQYVLVMDNNYDNKVTYNTNTYITTVVVVSTGLPPDVISQ